MKERAVCHDCGVMEGQIHGFGCDMEKCPVCGGQLITCGCCYDYLGLRDPEHHTEDTAFLPLGIYKGGLDETRENDWLEFLNQIGRIPFIVYPAICAKCGELWPKTFMVPDEEWEHYIEPAMRGQILCKPCYDWIKKMIDKWGSRE